MVFGATCLVCGGPLVAEGSRCGFCFPVEGATSADGDGLLAAARTLSSNWRGPAEGQQPLEALAGAYREFLHLEGEADSMAIVVLAMAQDFQREAQADIRRDAMALTRLTEGYLRALPELRQDRRAEINLPFLVATADGPRHLARTLTPELIAELAQRDPCSDGAPVPEEECGVREREPGPKKMRWWPFG